MIIIDSRKGERKVNKLGNWQMYDTGIYKGDFEFCVVHYAGCSEYIIVGKSGLAFKPKNLRVFLLKCQHTGHLDMKSNDPVGDFKRANK